MYVKGKRLWSHFDGVSMTPIYKGALDEWEFKDAQIIAWTLKYYWSTMINNLRSFSTASGQCGQAFTVGVRDSQLQTR